MLDFSDFGLKLLLYYKLLDRFLFYIRKEHLFLLYWTQLINADSHKTQLCTEFSLQSQSAD